MEPASTDQTANGDETPKRRRLSKRARTHLELYFEVMRLARRGYGYEDCLWMLEISRDPETVKWVRGIVLGRNWEKKP